MARGERPDKGWRRTKSGGVFNVHQKVGARRAKHVGAGSAGVGAPEGVLDLRRGDEEAADGELAGVHGAADVQPGVRRKARLGSAALKVAPGGGKTLADILPKDLTQLGRKEMAEVLRHSAVQCEKLGQMAQMSASLRTMAQVLGFLEKPEEAPPAELDPEERKRRICEAAASYGMQFPPGAEKGDP
jgi:hypothetical protein